MDKEEEEEYLEILKDYIREGIEIERKIYRLNLLNQEKCDCACQANLRVIASLYAVLDHIKLAGKV